MYFSQFERDEIDEELYRVKPELIPPSNYYRYSYPGFIGEEVSVKLNSKKKDGLEKILENILTSR